MVEYRCANPATLNMSAAHMVKRDASFRMKFLLKDPQQTRRLCVFLPLAVRDASLQWGVRSAGPKAQYCSSAAHCCSIVCALSSAWAELVLAIFSGMKRLYFLRAKTTMRRIAMKKSTINPTRTGMYCESPDC